MKNLEAKLAQIEATITSTQPYAKLVAEKGLDVNAKNQGQTQGWIDRARLFCEAVQQREEVLALLEG